MKKNYSFYSVLTAIPVALLILVSFSSGQPGNFTGSPGDGGATCTQCHSVSSANFGGSAALTGLPNGYMANQSYSVNLDMQGSTSTKIGFNITAELADGTKIGSWTPGTGTRLRTDSNGLTHNSTSTGSGQNSWDMTWTAPATDLGAVTFYYVTNQTNNNGSTSGDQVTTGQSSALLTNGDETISIFEMYPTQVTSLLNINLSNADNGTLMIYNMTGNRVKTLKLDRLNQLNMSDLTSGIYLAQVVVDNQVSVERFIKQ